MAGWFMINRMSNDANTASQRISKSVTFNIDKTIKAHTLKLGGDTITCWKFNSDSSQIILDELLIEKCLIALHNKDYFHFYIR
ncbi:MAG: hypothetical protein IPO92_10360 [Saprospiraceae bacterium]|nr:hypothetical protein [Saprospiraceae bacterium]